MRVQWVNSKGSPAVLWFPQKWMVQTFDETFRKIAEKHESSVGMFKNATGTSMIFVKNGWAIVKSIRVEKVQKSGVLVHAGNGVADNASGSIVRVDVFIKDRKYFLVPIYNLASG